MTIVTEGQVWKDNDPRGVRHVKVVRVDHYNDAPGRVWIRNCDHMGGGWGRITQTNIKRFGKVGRIGFTLISEPHNHFSGSK
jgi:hypothetical protein